jgi:hypothetical protein
MEMDTQTKLTQLKELGLEGLPPQNVNAYKASQMVGQKELVITKDINV